MERGLGTHGRLYTFGYRAPYRGGTSITKTRGGGSFAGRVTFGVGVSLDHAYNGGAYQTDTKGKSYTPYTLATTRYGGGKFYQGRGVTFLEVGTVGFLTLYSFGRRDVNRGLGYNITRRFGRFTYVFKTYRLLFGVVRTRTIIGTLVGCTTRFLVSFGSGGVFGPIFVDKGHYNGTYQAATSGCGVVRCFTPPRFISPMEV